MKTFGEIIKVEKRPTRNLEDDLRRFGVDDYVLNKYKDLISNINFININPDSKSAEIHFKMITALFTRGENDKTFLKNIIKKAELEEINKIDIRDSSAYQDIVAEKLEAENIDLDIGTNRRVDRIDCSFKDGNKLSFTLSADMVDVDDNESNSFQEKEVFQSYYGKDNPILQKFYGYSSRKFNDEEKRFIAKEYLPGKNIIQYFNELLCNEDSLLEMSSVSSDLGYSMSSLYNKGEGELLSDLKLENVIFNHEERDLVEYSCRVCDNSGFYEKEIERKSLFQILAHLQSLLSVFNNKKDQVIKTQGDVDTDISQEHVIESYLASFLDNLNKQSLIVFKKTIKKITENPKDSDIFEIDKDIIDYLNNYLESY